MWSVVSLSLPMAMRGLHLLDLHRGASSPSHARHTTNNPASMSYARRPRSFKTKAPADKRNTTAEITNTQVPRDSQGIASDNVSSSSAGMSAIALIRIPLLVSSLLLGAG